MIVVTGPVVSTTNTRLAVVEEALPIGSVAPTDRVWLPSASAVGTVNGVGQSNGAPPSMLQLNVARSFAESVKVGVVSVPGVPPTGPVIVGVGPVVSIPVQAPTDRR